MGNAVGLIGLIIVIGIIIEAIRYDRARCEKERRDRDGRE